MPLPDTSGVELGTDYPPVKAGWYEMIFEDYEEKQSKAGNDYTKITLKSTASERLAWCNMNHKEDSLWFVKQFKVALGMPDGEGNLKPYKGTHLYVYLQNREYDGKNYAEAKKFKPINDDSPPAQPADDSDLPF